MTFDKRAEMIIDKRVDMCTKSYYTIAGMISYQRKGADDER